MTQRSQFALTLALAAALLGGNAASAQDATRPETTAGEHVSTISRDWITTKLQDAGYTNVRDVELESGVWTAEANDSSGADIEIKLDAEDGHILGSSTDAAGGKK